MGAEKRDLSRRTFNLFFMASKKLPMQLLQETIQLCSSTWGGHMNVHRRDRAKLRQLPPWFFKFPECPTSNPNPNDHLLSSSSKFSPCPDHTHDHSPYLNSFSSPCCREKKSIVECHQSKGFNKRRRAMQELCSGLEN
ncbi:hypothetical protein OIU76_001504 [Salix suchowensis]|nr:hypothetical protein OIU76_001504 [Salix suchowensis]